MSRAALILLAAVVAGCGADASLVERKAADPAPPPTPSDGPDSGLASATPVLAPSTSKEERLPERLDISVQGARDLSVVEYLARGEKRGAGMVSLVGEISVTVTNPSASPIRLVHMDPANLVFTRLDTGEHFSLLHPCDPGLLLGSVFEPEELSEEDEARIFSSQVFVLGPGESRTFEMGGDWGCSGAPWKPVPEPGEYLVEYRVHALRPGWKPAVPEVGSGSIGDRLAAAREALSGDWFWEGAYRSEGTRVVFDRPKPKRLDY